MSGQADLFDVPAVDPEVEAIHDGMENRHAAFLARVRRILVGMYAGTGRAICTDEAHEVMQRYGIELPEGASPNVLGSLFSGFDRAKAVGWTRSKREGSHSNLLRTWQIR